MVGTYPSKDGLVRSVKVRIGDPNLSGDGNRLRPPDRTGKADSEVGVASAAGRETGILRRGAMHQGKLDLDY